MLKHTKGNLLDLAEQGKFDIIVHGCNCQNVMGSGIAKEIKERCPDAWNADVEATSKFPKPILKLGNVSMGRRVGKNGAYGIINAYTQLHYYPRGIDHFEYESFSMILRKLSVIGPKFRYGFPYIGMGLAGGDKEKILTILEDFAKKVTETGGSVTLVEFD
jgi:O-acetyl-ADP-ribose deacetylase (regulator of RNase III)